MLDLGACLRYYKRTDVQKALIDAAEGKEISVRYLDGGFGKRPDVLLNNSDVLENVKNKASSFHCSEELWLNPQQISTNMKRDEILRLRKGWDLVLDIDCPIWELSKITTWLFIEALKAHGIKSISLKFSGNKGFHIGVPFKSFPKTVPGKEIFTKEYFPEGPRRIAAYLVEYISKNLIVVSDNSITFGNKVSYTFDQLLQLTGKNINELSDKITIKDGKEVKVKTNVSIVKQKYHYQCAVCGNKEVFDEEQRIVSCSKCRNIMEQLSSQKKQETQVFTRRFNPLSIVEVDTVLIAPRHLYRMPYSLHEKSGLASIPIAVERILLFEKDEASPDKAMISEHKFLDDSETVEGEAERLLKDSFDFNPIIERSEEDKRIKKAFVVGEEQITQKIPEELFPPCIKLLLQPLKDGKKRAMFILMNFLSSVGWNYDEISERLYEWNKIQPEPLRENLIVTHVNYNKQQMKKVLPPNCPEHATAQYYRDM
ncbi:MAG TPA: DNA primase small subunit domain-containing protein, partial [Candidatus Nanoarchaeia archaeon]|nr:DNA primase small subunit domain-containing protein [Candidatus Nanoarchaeia archaeon]